MDSRNFQSGYETISQQSKNYPGREPYLALHLLMAHPK